MINRIFVEQKKIAKNAGADWLPCEPRSMVGVSDGVNENIFPINGLRHPPEGSGTGWFIWVGEREIPKDNPNFFAPVHAEHLILQNPLIAKYLGLPPGWRFLVDNKGYEDVWFDETLLTPSA